MLVQFASERRQWRATRRKLFDAPGSMQVTGRAQRRQRDSCESRSERWKSVLRFGVWGSAPEGRVIGAQPLSEQRAIKSGEARSHECCWGAYRGDKIEGGSKREQTKGTHKGKKKVGRSKRTARGGEQRRQQTEDHRRLPSPGQDRRTQRI